MNIKFLTLDHINGDGSQHRKTIPASYFYRWVIKNDYPKTLQILCWNCNWAKGFYKICPHQEK